MKRAFIILVGILAVTQLGVSTTQAAIITLSFSEAPSSGNYGNFIVSGPGVSTPGELTAHLSSWSVGKSPGNTFTNSRVRQWSTGIGSCNRSEGLNCSSPNHAVDNGGSDNRIDVLLIQFSEPVILHEAALSRWTEDYDASFWAGTGDLTSLMGLDLTDLTNLAFDEARHDSFGDDSNNTRDVVFADYYADSEVDWLIFGAAVTSDPSFAFVNSSSSTWWKDKKKNDLKNDAFKFGLSVELQENEVPAPGVLVLLGAGALALGLTRRRWSSPKKADG
jgi:hypothetical protein